MYCFPYTRRSRASPAVFDLFRITEFWIKQPAAGRHEPKLGYYWGGYISEVFRGALESVDENEITAARAMGFSDLQIILYIEFPQMLRFSIPGVMNELTSILKNTPFAYTVGITEILGQAKALTASTMLGMNIYLISGVLYFVIYQFFVLIMKKTKNKYAVE